MKSNSADKSDNRVDFLANGIAQVCLIVEDIEEAVKNYWDVFGIGPWQFYTYGKPLVKRMTRHGKPTEYKMKVALANIGPLRIELIQHLRCCARPSICHDKYLVEFSNYVRHSY
jgi:hypothetical protein